MRKLTTSQLEAVVVACENELLQHTHNIVPPLLSDPIILRVALAKLREGLVHKHVSDARKSLRRHRKESLNGQATR